MLVKNFFVSLPVLKCSVPTTAASRSSSDCGALFIPGTSGALALELILPPPALLSTALLSSPWLPAPALLPPLLLLLLLLLAPPTGHMLRGAGRGERPPLPFLSLRLAAFSHVGWLRR